MKIKGRTPQELCELLLKRSECSVQVAAVLSDKKGIFAWGWNHSGPDGFGEHAEVNALKRSNYKRVSGAVLWVASRRKKSKSTINSKPCAACWPFVRQCRYVVYRNKAGEWKVLHTGQELSEGFEER